MTNKAILIQDYFDELLPNASCELNYSKPYELVIAVMLSAQTTDKSVNLVTEKLFSKYTSLYGLNNASLNEIENIIRSIGLYKNKAANLKGIVNKLLIDFDGKVPADKEQLMSLPGVGNKTANVILAEIFHIPEFPVDTHVFRVSKRLGLTTSKDDVMDTEKKLKKTFLEDSWIKLHHQFIHFGRYYCTARNPKCKNCKLLEICSEK